MSATGDRRPTPGLAEAIVMGLRALRDLTRPPPEVTSGDLEHVLRTAIARSATADGRPVGEPAVLPPLENAAVAARTACAYSSARDLTHAYLALRAAREALPHEPHEATRAQQQDMSCVPGLPTDDEADRADRARRRPHCGPVDPTVITSAPLRGPDPRGRGPVVHRIPGGGEDEPRRRGRVDALPFEVSSSVRADHARVRPQTPAWAWTRSRRRAPAGIPV